MRTTIAPPRAALWPALLALLCTTPLAAAGVEVKELDGRSSTLAAQVKPDRFTLIMLWTTYCHVCKGDYPEVSAFHDAHLGKDAEVVGISLDGYDEIAKVREFVARKPFSFPTVVADADRMGRTFEEATGEKFTGTPTYLMFNPKRQLVAARSGDLTREVLENFLRKHAEPE